MISNEPSKFTAIVWSHSKIFSEFYTKFDREDLALHLALWQRCNIKDIE